MKLYRPILIFFDEPGRTEKSNKRRRRRLADNLAVLATFYDSPDDFYREARRELQPFQQTAAVIIIRDD